MVKVEAKKVGTDIVISEDSFEHLLNCLANQKYIADINSDGMADGEKAIKAVQEHNQAAIDDFYRQCMEVLHE